MVESILSIIRQFFIKTPLENTEKYYRKECNGEYLRLFRRFIKLRTFMISKKLFSKERCYYYPIISTPFLRRTIQQQIFCKTYPDQIVFYFFIIATKLSSDKKKKINKAILRIALNAIQIRNFAWELKGSLKFIIRGILLKKKDSLSKEAIICAVDSVDPWINSERALISKDNLNIGKYLLDQQEFQKVAFCSSGNVYNSTQRIQAQAVSSWHDFFYLKPIDKFLFLKKSIYTITVTLLQIAINRGSWRKYLLSDTIRAIFIEHGTAQNDQVNFLFTCSGLSYKPVWVNVFEKKYKRDAIFHWYASCVFPSTNQHPEPDQFGIRLMDWKREITVSKSHEKFLRNLRSKSDAQPSYQSFPQLSEKASSPDWAVKIPEKEKIISVLTPMVFSTKKRLGIGSIHDIYGPEITSSAITFIDQIIKACDELGFSVLLKDKRKTPFEPVEYIEFRNRISELDSVYVIDQESSLESIFLRSLGSVHWPCSTTGLLAQECNTPSIYYDVSGLISKRDPVLMGVPLVNNFKSLKDFIANIAQ